MILGYAQVSKGEPQDTRLQETALRAAGVERLFTEQASGGRWDRPQLHRLLAQGSAPYYGAPRAGRSRLSQSHGSH